MKLWTCLMCFLCLLSHSSFATHVKGAYLSYEQTDSFKYEIYLSFYRDCKGVSFSNPSGNTSLVCSTYTKSVNLSLYSIEMVTPINDSVTNPCFPVNTNATGNGTEKHVYKASIDFNSPAYSDLKNCCEVIVQTAQCCRSNSINTGGAGTTFYNYIKINLCRTEFNSSPKLHFDWMSNTCCNQPARFNLAVRDTIDDDSLSFSFAAPLTDYNTTVGYIGTYYAYDHPIQVYYPGSLTPPYHNPSASPPIGIYLDPEIGDIIYTPTRCNEITVLVIKVTEWRKDSSGTYQEIGYSRIEQQMINSACPDNNMPEIEGPLSYLACEGEQLCFDIISIDHAFVPPPPAQTPPKDSVKLFWDESIEAASFTILNKGSLYETGRFCWIPDSNSARNRPYYFNVQARDSEDPINAVSSYTFSIRVRSEFVPKINLREDACGRFSIGTPLSEINPGTYVQWILSDTNEQTLNRSQGFLLSSDSSMSTKRTDEIRIYQEGVYRLYLLVYDSLSNCNGLRYLDFSVDSGNIFRNLQLDFKLDTLGCGKFGVQALADSTESDLTYEYVILDSTGLFTAKFNEASFIPAKGPKSTLAEDSLIVYLPGKYVIKLWAKDSIDRCPLVLEKELDVIPEQLIQLVQPEFDIDTPDCGIFSASLTDRDSGRNLKFGWSIYRDSSLADSTEAHFISSKGPQSSHEHDSLLMLETGLYGLRLELEDVSSGCKFIHRDSLHAGQNLIYYLTDQRILLDTLACGWYKLSLTASPSYLDATWSVEDTNNRTLSGMDTAFFGSSQMPVSQTYQDSLAVLWPYDLWVRFKGQSHNPRCFGQDSVLLLADQNYLYKDRPAPVIFRDGERLRVKDSILVDWYRNEIYVQTSLELEILSIGAYKARFCEGTCCSEFSNIIEKTSGLDEFDPGLLVIYPNPSTGDFVLEAPNDFLIEAEIQVFDLRGKHKEFECQMLSSGKMSISTDLSPGIYLIALKSASGLIYKTIVLY